MGIICTPAKAGELLPQNAFRLLAEVVLKSDCQLGVVSRTNKGKQQGTGQEDYHGYGDHSVPPRFLPAGQHFIQAFSQ